MNQIMQVNILEELQEELSNEKENKRHYNGRTRKEKSRKFKKNVLN